MIQTSTLYLFPTDLNITFYSVALTPPKTLDKHRVSSLFLEIGWNTIDNYLSRFDLETTWFNEAAMMSNYRLPLREDLLYFSEFILPELYNDSEIADKINSCDLADKFLGGLLHV